MVIHFALLHFLVHPVQVFGGGECKDNREEFGFALAGHDLKTIPADNFARCFFECSLDERCQSATFLWNNKECQLKKETKKSRPEDFVENPAATCLFPGGTPMHYLYGYMYVPLNGVGILKLLI